MSALFFSGTVSKMCLHSVNTIEATKYITEALKMFEWCEKMIEATGCDLDTAMREYYATFYPGSYESEDYE